ncbi:DNA polymerase III subunit alpha [Telmatospirillum siberiense]|uniref:DNA polymerase III subunit alpha n=1 Tax=Telmatospirillum siberiense TaxID=382514 RepID=A0A2N3PZF6_9PROT|nr:DNA polymerase III subunit alpha [Telmatospirillum siberiense]PKU25797.1 DNA polymerase III subunit alpha [Telmatospirillum siberiense]
MPHADFVHLRVHTAYSLAEGAIKIKPLVKLCEKMHMPAVAMTDTGNLFGAMEFSNYCADAGIQPIIGVQLHVRRESEVAKGFGGGRDQGRTPEPDQLVLLVQNETGYANVLKLVSKAFLETDGGETPQVDMTDVTAHAEGLLALSGGPRGAVGRLLGEGQPDKAEAALVRLEAAFPGRLYIELQRHGLALEEAIEPGLIGLADSHELPLVATNEPFFTDGGMYEAHDALLCIAEGAYVSQDERRRLTVEHRFKSAEEMRTLFADLPEAVDNTVVVARRCAFMVKKRKPLLPPFHIPGMTEVEVLRKMSTEGLERRLEAHVFTPDMDEQERERVAKPYHERMEYELGIIIQMGFPGYFLIVADFIQWSKANGVPVGPGRGSGAGSVVAWALTITDLDPLRWGLLFERFLNPERVSMPDFDVDFCQDNREKTIHYVQNKYGYDHVAQIITFGKLQARAVLRDVGRVLQMPYGQVDRLCKLVPNNPADPVTLEEAIEREPLLKEMQQSDEQVAHLLDIGMKLEGLYRHASTHAAGVVIGDRPLDQLVPLYRDPRSDMPVTQYNMKWVESTGLIKFDFLGLKTLTVLHRCVDIIRRTTGDEIDLTAIPLDDTSTYEMLARGETVGVFQLESSGMRDVLRKMKADRFEDIIAVVALYRPGPMDNIPHYIAVKQGLEPPDYLHPRLEKILKETHGIMIYQEQVMQIAQELSGYTLGGADLLRRAMGKKIQAEMDAQRKLFVDGAMAREVDKTKASEIFDQVNKFAGYGFNKSHAAAYALVAYQTAWLKANYPVAFIAASMTYDMHNTDKLNVFRQELDRLKIKLLPPDINKSGPDFWAETVGEGEWAVRYALAALKNVGTAAMEALAAERKAHGPFRDLGDFARRIDAKAINKRQMENLVKAGALDSLSRNRGQLFEGIEVVLREAQSAAGDRETGQSSLFGGAATPTKLVLPNRPDWAPVDKLQQEFDAIGFYLSAHPMDAYGKSLTRLGVLKSNELVRHLSAGGKSRVKLAGTLNAKQERVSSRGSRYAFLSLSDAAGLFEVMVFSELLATTRDLLENNTPLLVTVEARLEDEQLRMTAQQIESLDQAAAKAAAGLKIFIRDEAPLDTLKTLVAKEARGRGRIVLVAQTEEREVEAWLSGSYALSPSLIGAVKTIPGVVEVQEL